MTLSVIMSQAVLVERRHALGRQYYFNSSTRGVNFSNVCNYFALPNTTKIRKSLPYQIIFLHSVIKRSWCRMDTDILCKGINDYQEYCFLELDAVQSGKTLPRCTVS
jgi:hypothetical protein